MFESSSYSKKIAVVTGGAGFLGFHLSDRLIAEGFRVIAVDNLVNGIFRLAMSEYHEPINIGNPREMTILEFADKILEITGSKSEIIKKPLPADDPKVRRPDITRARQLLCWEPKVDFEFGIRETISYFQVRKAA